MCVARNASVEINLFFFAFTVWQIISFTQHCTHGLHWYNLWTVHAYYFLFFFLSRWILERVELEAGPEHPRIKIVPEDWFLWISKNKDNGENLNGILWFFPWWRKHCLNTGISSYLLCNSIQHFVNKRCCAGQPLFGYMKVKDKLYASEINSVSRKKTWAVIFKANEVWEMNLRIPYWLIR